jgi:Meckel syndrome type 1 protein
MNTHRPDDEHLPGEDELAALYRKLPRKEPGPALDAAVLRAAAQAVKTAEPAATKRWPRWPIALSSAAVLVLAAGLGWRMRDMPASVPTATPGAVSVQASAPAVEAAPAADQAQLPAPAPPPPTEPVHSAAPKTQQANIPVAKPAAPAMARVMQPQAKQAPALAAKRAVADQAAPVAANEPSAFAQQRTEATAGNQPLEEKAAPPAPTPRLMAAPTIAPAPPTPPADTARDAHDTPAQELDKIRLLFATQRRDEARQRLADFHRDHPDYPLPDDLREQLLTP